MVGTRVKVLLDAIALAEGHGKSLTYNTTYGYDKYVNGPVSLVDMSIGDVQDLQRRMLDRQKGKKLRSSAIGRYQFITKTLENCRKAFGYPKSRKFDEETQDNFGAYLLHLRGFDRWQAGKLSRSAFQNNLAKEWASIPTTEGKSYYGQGVGITQAQLNWALDKALLVEPTIRIVPEIIEISWFQRLLNWLFGGK